MYHLESYKDLLLAHYYFLSLQMSYWLIFQLKIYVLPKKMAFQSAMNFNNNLNLYWIDVVPIIILVIYYVQFLGIFTILTGNCWINKVVLLLLINYNVDKIVTVRFLDSFSLFQILTNVTNLEYVQNPEDVLTYLVVLSVFAQEGLN